MVNIKIRPAAWHAAGSLKADGHAGRLEEGTGIDLVCASVSTLLEGLAVNLTEMAGITTKLRQEAGNYSIRWSREYHGAKPNALSDANSAAWHFYRALSALAKTYPDNVSVRWIKQEYIKPGKGRPKRNETE